ncbi:hypothetical protein Barb7_01456 [Bacteroidales bacterium Barb7]|nr:hypothetical protein Barb7_01456 [Bacteroidales bacterium Barb7]
MVVRYADGCPHAADFASTFAEDFEMPHFFRVGYGQAFAAVGVSVFRNQFAHKADGGTGGGATFKRQPLQLFNHKHSLPVNQLLAPRDGCFADAQLLFVETGIGRVQEAVSGADLGDFALQNAVAAVGDKLRVHQSVVNPVHRILFILAGRHNFHPCAVIAVAGVAGDDGAVGGGFFPDHDTRTAFGVVRRQTVRYFLRLHGEGKTQKRYKNKQFIHDNND